jgi:hypothetical protein
MTKETTVITTLKIVAPNIKKMVFAFLFMRLLPYEVGA